EADNVIDSPIRLLTSAATGTGTRRHVSLRFQQLDGLTDGLLGVGDDSRLAPFFPNRFYIQAAINISGSGAGVPPASPGVSPAKFERAGETPAPGLAGATPAPLSLAGGTPAPLVALLPVHYAPRSVRWRFDV